MAQKFQRGTNTYLATILSEGTVLLVNEKTGQEIPRDTKVFRDFADPKRRKEKFKPVDAKSPAPAKVEKKAAPQKAPAAKKAIRDMSYEEAEQIVLNAAHNARSVDRLKAALVGIGFDARTFQSEGSTRELDKKTKKPTRAVVHEFSVMGPKRERIYFPLRTQDQ